jgi:hypothetical protein
MYMARMFKSGELVRMLQVPYHVIADAIRHGDLQAPQRDGSGDYVWTEKDVTAVRKLLKRYRPRKSRPTLASM